MADSIFDKDTGADGVGPIQPQRPERRPSSYDEIKKIFSENVVELRFERRTPLPVPRTTGHKRRTRRMLATANWSYLKMAVRRGSFRWKQPKRVGRRDPSWYRRRNLLIVWDIIQQDFRIISLDNWRILAYYPVNTPATQARFAVFYRKRLTRLNRVQRDAYSDK